MDQFLLEYLLFYLIGPTKQGKRYIYIYTKIVYRLWVSFVRISVQHRECLSQPVTSLYNTRFNFDFSEPCLDFPVEFDVVISSFYSNL